MGKWRWAQHFDARKCEMCWLRDSLRRKRKALGGFIWARASVWLGRTAGSERARASCLIPESGAVVFELRGRRKKWRRVHARAQDKRTLPVIGLMLQQCGEKLRGSGRKQNSVRQRNRPFSCIFTGSRNLKCTDVSASRGARSLRGRGNCPKLVFNVFF